MSCSDPKSFEITQVSFFYFILICNKWEDNLTWFFQRGKCVYPLWGVPLKINSLSMSTGEAALLPRWLWSFPGSPIRSRGIPPPKAPGREGASPWPFFSSPPPPRWLIPASFLKRRYFHIMTDFKNVFTGEVFVTSCHLSRFVRCHTANVNRRFSPS